MTQLRSATTSTAPSPDVETQPRYTDKATSHYRLKYTVVWMAIDVLIMIAAYTAAFSARAFVSPLGITEGVAFVFFIMLVTLGFLCMLGVYHRMWSQTSGHSVSVIINAVIAATLVVSLVEIVFVTPRPVPLSVILLGNMLALSGFVAARYRSRLVSGLSWRWRAIWRLEFPTTPTRVLIIGAGEAGQTLAWRLKHRSPDKSNCSIVGFVDDDPAKHGMYIEECPVLGARADIPRLAESYKVDLIVLAIHNISAPAFREVLTYCESTKARIKAAPDMFALVSDRHGAPLLRDVQAEDFFLGRKPIGRHEGVDLEPVTNRVILVTGAAGSIGAELCRQLLSYDPVELILLDNNESGLHDVVTELSAKSAQAKLVPVLADITSKQALSEVFIRHRPQVIFHAAAYKHVPMLQSFPREAVRVNILGTWHVARLARDNGVERFVLISTDKAVHPSSVMGASKHVCELLMHALSRQGDHQTLFTSVRFGNVLGSRGSVLPTFNRQIDSGGPVTVTDKDMTRYFMSTSEAVNLVIHAACLTKGDDLFMLKMGEVVRIVELARRMIRMRGLRPYEDIEIKFIGPRPGEKLCEQLQSETEKTIETIHPNIIELASQDGDLQSTAFLEQLDDLLNSRLDDTTDVLNRLLALARTS